jgi:glycosyltransferase involved in cell wall biosynthesis
MAASSALISVLITSYNYRHYITRAIDSVLAQTYPNVEIIVSDNASTDGTPALLHERYGAEPRVRVYENDTNRGELWNSNRAFELSSGEFVLWLSADDWMLPRHLARLHDVFEREPQVDVVHSGAYYADAESRVWTLRLLRGQLPFDYVDARDEVVEMFTTTCPLCWPAALFRRSVFLELGVENPADGIHATDWEMQIRLALGGKRFAYLQDPSTVVRLHGGQQTSQVYVDSSRAAMDYVAILEKFADEPAAIARLRGRETAVVAQLDRMVNEAQASGEDPFTAAQRARIAAQRTCWVDRAAAYRPALVREARISVIVPTPQAPQLAERAIASVAAQTHPNWELVIVDHGPMPFEELFRANTVWNRMSYVRSPYSFSAGRARNFGMRLARGEYLVFLDEDHTLAPEHLAALVATIERSGGTVAASGARTIFESADATMTTFTPLREERFHRTGAEAAQLRAVAPVLPLGALLLHRSVQDHAGAFDETLPFLDDFEYVLRLDGPFAPAFAEAETLEVRVRVQLNSALGAYLQQVPALLDRVYAAHPVSPALTAGRAAYRADVERAIRGVVGQTVTVDAIVGLVATLSGRGNG